MPPAGRSGRTSRLLRLARARWSFRYVEPPLFTTTKNTKAILPIFWASICTMIWTACDCRQLSCRSGCRSLRSDQSKSLINPPFQFCERQSICQHSQDDHHNHDGHDLSHIVHISAGLEKEPQPMMIDHKNEFRAHERSPGKA